MRGKPTAGPSRPFVHYILTQALLHQPCEVRGEYALARLEDEDDEAYLRPLPPRSARFTLHPAWPTAETPALEIATVPERWFRSTLAAFATTFSLGLYGGFDRSHLLRYQGQTYRCAVFAGNDSLTGHWLKLRISAALETDDAPTEI